MLINNTINEKERKHEEYYLNQDRFLRAVLAHGPFAGSLDSVRGIGQ